MKDKILLIITGIVCALLAWIFFYSAGEDSFSIMSMILIICLMSDNYRLRKKIKAG